MFCFRLKLILTLFFIFQSASRSRKHFFLCAINIERRLLPKEKNRVVKVLQSRRKIPSIHNFFCITFSYRRIWLFHFEHLHCYAFSTAIVTNEKLLEKIEWWRKRREKKRTVVRKTNLHLLCVVVCVCALCVAQVKWVSTYFLNQLRTDLRHWIH